MLTRRSFLGALAAIPMVPVVSRLAKSIPKIDLAPDPSAGFKSRQEVCEDLGQTFVPWAAPGDPIGDIRRLQRMAMADPFDGLRQYRENALTAARTEACIKILCQRPRPSIWSRLRLRARL